MEHNINTQNANLDIDIEEEDITYPFDPTKIKIDSKVATIDSLIKRLKFDEIDLSPDFQRSDSIWEDRERSRLIESLLVRIPIPAFYIDASNEERWVIIDGLQRLTTLRRYVVSEEFALSELEYLTNLNGLKYSQLPRKFQRRIEETQVTLMLVEKGTPRNVIFNLFKRINTGGSSLTPQEIRHALNIGMVTNVLNRLINIDLFKKIWGAEHSRMEGHEIALRAIAYLVTPIEDVVKSNYDDFLNLAMEKINLLSQSEADSLCQQFEVSLNAAYEIFDGYAFRKQFEYMGRKSPLNKPLFESWIYNLSKQSPKTLKLLYANSKKMNGAFISLMNSDQRFNYSISSGKPHAIKYRMVKISELIDEVLNDL